MLGVERLLRTPRSQFACWTNSPWRERVAMANCSTRTLYRFDRTAKLRTMKEFTLEYWTDDGWFVGRLKEMPAVMSQGETLEKLQAMIRDAYRLMVEDAAESTFVPKERHEMAISL